MNEGFGKDFYRFHFTKISSYVMICMVSSLVRCKRLKGRRRAEFNLLGYKLWCLHYVRLCTTGAVPVVWGGGHLYPSIPRSPGVSPQKERAAHGPPPCGEQCLEILLVFLFGFVFRPWFW